MTRIALKPKKAQLKGLSDFFFVYMGESTKLILRASMGFKLTLNELNPLP
jgi:hypothetical protein